MSESYVAFKGGVDQRRALTDINPGSLVKGINVYESPRGGYRGILGYRHLSSGYESPITYLKANKVTINDYDAAKVIRNDLIFIFLEATGSTASYVYFSPNDWDEISTNSKNFFHPFYGSGSTYLNITEVSKDYVGESINEFYQLQDFKFTAAKHYYSLPENTSSPNEFLFPLCNGESFDITTEAREAIWNNNKILEVTVSAGTILTNQTTYSGDSGSQLVVDHIVPAYEKGAIKENSYLVFGNISANATQSSFTSHGITGWTDDLSPTGSFIYSNGATNYGEKGIIGSFSYYFEGYEFIFFWMDGRRYFKGPTGTFPIYLPESGFQVTCMSAFRDRLAIGGGRGRLLLSVPNEPLNFHGSLFAADIFVGSSITGLKETGDGRLFIFTKNGVKVLTGTTNSNFQLENVSDSVSAYFNGVAQLDDIYSIDSRGIHRISLIDNSSGFDLRPVSDPIKSRFDQLKDKYIGLTVHKELNQIRFYFGRTFLMMTVIQESDDIRISWSEGLLDRNPYAAASEHQSYLMFDDSELTYQLDTGYSFDGQPIDCMFISESNSLQTPKNKKRFREASLDIQSPCPMTLKLNYAIDYQSYDYSTQVDSSSFDMLGFDEAAYGTDFYDTAPLSRLSMPLVGSGKNLQVGFNWSSDYLPSPVFYGYTLSFSMRGKV